MPSASFYSSPFGRRLGDLLQSQLDSGDWTSLSGAIAWVRSSGVRHLSESLRRFAVAGGTARIAIGIDFGGSTAEGLSLLNEAVGPSGEIWIVHHDNPRTTFHPKAVLLENRKTAVAFIGSGNLTEGGLFSNFELGTELVFDLGISDDADARASLRMELDRYLGGGWHRCFGARGDRAVSEGDSSSQLISRNVDVRDSSHSRASSSTVDFHRHEGNRRRRRAAKDCES
jgi:hypothetical protein